MSNINIVVISGNIANELELRYTPQGTAVLDFTVAVNNGFGDKQETAFIGCTAWSKSAESMAQYLAKGSKVNVSGRLSQDSWQDRETGKKRTKTKVIADRVEFLNSRQNDAPAPQKSASQSSGLPNSHGGALVSHSDGTGSYIPPTENLNGSEFEDSDDIPF